MAVMFVQILSPLFTIPPASLTIPTGQLAVLATLVLGGMGLSVLLAARSLRRLNPVELLRAGDAQAVHDLIEAAQRTHAPA
jgi:ABC-type antimicrobial peptide transport system permease subunit